LSRRPTRLLNDDGLSLSHFIINASSSVLQHDDGATSSAADKDLPPIIQPAEIGGDEYYDDDVDFIVTDAMQSRDSSTTAAAPTTALDRLKQQMIANEGDDVVDENNDSMTMMTLKFHLKTYGCQMNVNDTDIVRSILINHHHTANTNPPTTEDASSSPSSSTTSASLLRFIETNNEIEANVLLTNTCAIRDNAEQKVWHRLKTLRSHDKNYPLPITTVNNTTALTKTTTKNKKKRIVCVLGCMAERLKDDMFKDGTADVVVGPDAYRSLPNLISTLVITTPPSTTATTAHPKITTTKSPLLLLPTERAMNVQLSHNETYSDIFPLRAPAAAAASNNESVTAFVSIMRGCNNMCSYCVVPFTRGRERSRDMTSIIHEIRRLIDEEDIREVILLGQNVNSYHDSSSSSHNNKNNVNNDNGGTTTTTTSTYRTSNDGFTNIFRLRHGSGHRFADLLDEVSNLSPELRVRFTSPHPKDYPPDLLSLMSERSNICNQLHMPAQSGSSSVLERMRRGYTREAYLELIHDVRTKIPNVALSSDFISGFCDETEDEHEDTVSLLRQVQFDQAYMFAYSMREKTHAHRTMIDNVLPHVKARRLNEIITTFRSTVQFHNEQVELGQLRLVLIEGEAKRSTVENKMFSGRTDQNKRVVFDSEPCWIEEEFVHLHPPFFDITSLLNVDANDVGLQTKVELSRGDYVIVHITDVRGHTLKGRCIMRSSIVGFERLMNMHQSLLPDSSSSTIDRIMTL
jgi:tRNA A37 methylthiotransferase MiaB